MSVLAAYGTESLTKVRMNTFLRGTRTRQREHAHTRSIDVPLSDVPTVSMGHQSYMRPQAQADEVFADSTTGTYTYADRYSDGQIAE